MVKKIFLFTVALCASINCNSYEEPNVTDIKSFYSGHELIFLGKKIGGFPELDLYKESMKQYSTLDGDELEKKWSVYQDAADEFLVLKIYKGDTKMEGTLINAMQNSKIISTTSIFDTYLMFVNKSNEYDRCGAILLENIESLDLKKIDADELINSLVEYKLTPCFRDSYIRWDE